MLTRHAVRSRSPRAQRRRLPDGRRARSPTASPRTSASGRINAILVTSGSVAEQVHAAVPRHPRDDAHRRDRPAHREGRPARRPRRSTSSPTTQTVDALIDAVARFSLPHAADEFAPAHRRAAAARQDCPVRDDPAPRVVVLAGGVGGSRFVARRARGAARARPRRHRRSRSPSSSTPATTCGCRASDCSPTSTRSSTRSPASTTPSAAGAARATASGSTTSCRSGARAGRGSRSATSTSARTSPAPAGCATGSRPTQVLERMSRRWPLGARLLPMTDAEVDTDGACCERRHRSMHFQEWWTRHRATLEPVRFDNPGIERRRPGARRASRRSPRPTSCCIAPSNPVVSIGPILAVPGIREALRATAARRRRGVADHRRTRRARHGRRVPHRDRRRDLGRGGRRALRRARGRRAARRVADRRGGRGIAPTRSRGSASARSSRRCG